MCTNGTQVPCKVPSLPKPTTGQGWPRHRGLRPLLFLNSDVGCFTSHKTKSLKVVWDGTYGFSSLSEKTTKSNHLQMPLQRQHFLLSYLKTLSVGPPAFEPATSRSADRRSPNWGNQAAIRQLNRYRGILPLRQAKYLGKANTVCKRQRQTSKGIDPCHFSYPGATS